MPLGRRIYKKRVIDGVKYLTRRRKGGVTHKGYISQKQRTGKGMSVAPSSNILLHTPLLPLSKNGKLPYAEAGVALATGALGVPNAYVFTANGLYDPNITGVGHQPMGFDQMMLFYEHYTVGRSKITVNFKSTDAVNACMVGILIAPDNVVGNVTTTLLENGMYVKKNLSRLGTDGDSCSITVFADISKINGKRDVKSENDFRGDIASNPTEQTYFQVFCYNIWTVAASSCIFEALIEYDAVFTEPRKMIAS